MNRPKQVSVRVTPNRHLRKAQPNGYYSQIAPLDFLHSSAKKRRKAVAKEAFLNR